MPGSTLKNAVSISLGSSTRNGACELNIGDQRVRVERIGTDGSLARATTLIRQYDGSVEAIGLGGVNLCYQCGAKKYPLPAGVSLAQAARTTPVVDGSALKEYWEPWLVQHLPAQGIQLQGKTVLLSSALDRFFLAAALEEAGARVLIGDALFALQLPLLFPSLKSFTVAGRLTLPLLRRLPLRWLYPLGKQQEKIKPRFNWAFRRADILAGDFHFFRRFLPADLSGKVLLTSTLTRTDVELLHRRNARQVIATLPITGGRAYGANVWEAALTAALGQQWVIEAKTNPADFFRQLKWQPRVFRP